MKEDTVSAEAEAGLLDPERLSEIAFSTCKELLKLLEEDPTLAADLGSKFEPALSDIVEITISPLAPEFGAFTIDDNCMVVNAEDAARLFSYVISDMRAQLIDSGGALDPEEVRTILHDTLSLFVLHEIRHRTQGVGNFSTIQLLKKIDGREHLSKFDVQADRDAAIALAAARVGGTKDTSAFLEYYQSALYYSVRYFFKIYPANVDRLDKTCRIAALLFMLARLQVYIRLGQLSVGQPTDALHVAISDDHESIAVFANEPCERLLRAANDPELPSFVRNIETGNLQDALGQALRLAVALELV